MCEVRSIRRGERRRRKERGIDVLLCSGARLDQCFLLLHSCHVAVPAPAKRRRGHREWLVCWGADTAPAGKGNAGNSILILAWQILLAVIIPYSVPVPFLHYRLQQPIDN